MGIKTTINDIAREAKVSKATVSMVLNGSPKVSQQTNEKVRAIMQDLHYQPNEEARRLALRRKTTRVPFSADYPGTVGNSGGEPVPVDPA